MNDFCDNPDLRERANALFEEHQQRIFQRTDRMFAVLMLIQWLAAIGGALWLSPLTWEGDQSRVHPHVWMAVVLGGALSSLPVILACHAPGKRVTRYTIAVAQVLFSSLLIHITGGRIETHFHVFGSLAFLAAYRDWKLLIPPTLVVAVDHLLRGMFWPETVFGVVTASSWRWLEHAGWVIFEDIFLIITIRQSVSEMKQTSRQTAQLEWNHAHLKRTAEELNRVFAREGAIIEGALDAVIVMDMQGNIVSWNGQAEATFGWSAGEAVGSPLADLIIPATYREAHTAGLRQYQHTREGNVLNRRVELEALRRDGSVFQVEVAITPIHGEETTFCAFIRDITERKSHESALHQAKEQAEAANHAKSEFLANMSHEIRTPLSGILGFTEVLKRGVGTEEQRASYLNTIHSSGQHLLTLINDILDLSKVEAGRMEFEQVRCCPFEVLSDVLSVLRVRAQEKGLRLDCKWTTPFPETILTDPARLRQLLMNLVANAIKFTERGGVTVRATVDREAPEPRLIIDVEDTGIGIDAEQIKRIFLPFDQADNSITRRFGGTGLGLTISQHIARGLGGEITAASQPGEGSVFRVKLPIGALEGVPLLESDLSEALKVSRSREPAEPETACLEGGRVLLVEDGETNRELITLVLEEAGATVVGAADGHEGVVAAEGERFDLILMDMQMPVMDGYTATRILRSRGCALPIVALTAHAMREDRDKCLAAGCTDYLTKPIEIDSLLRTVKAVFQGTSVVADAGSEVEAPEAEPEAIVSSLPMNHPRFQRIVADFVGTLAGKLEGMERALQTDDWSELAELAHWLKGAGGTVGFACLTEPAAQLEQSARSHDPHAAGRALHELQSLAERIILPELVSGD